MRIRYDWSREYKGSHPRGNLSTPDYQAARAKERQEESDRLFTQALSQYDERVQELTVQLDNSVFPLLSETNQEIFNRYLQMCSDEAYQAIANHAYTYFNKLAESERKNNT